MREESKFPYEGLLLGMDMDPFIVSSSRRYFVVLAFKKKKKQKQEKIDYIIINKFTSIK